MHNRSKRLAALEAFSTHLCAPQFGWEYQPGCVELDTGERMSLDTFCQRYPDVKLYGYAPGWNPNEV